MSTPRAAQRRPKGCIASDKRANVVGFFVEPKKGSVARARDSVGAGSTPFARHQGDASSSSTTPAKASASAAAWRFGSELLMPAPTAAATVTPADTAASRDRDEPCNARYRDAINDEAARSASWLFSSPLFSSGSDGEASSRPSPFWFSASSSSSSSSLTSSSSSSSNRFPRKAPGCL